MAPDEEGYRLAVQIAKQEKCRYVDCAVGALLHDVDDVKISPETYAAKRKMQSILWKATVWIIKLLKMYVILLEEVSFAGTDSVVPSTLEGNACRMRTGWMQWERLNRNEDIGLIENPEWKRGPRWKRNYIQNCYVLLRRKQPLRDSKYGYMKREYLLL